jgi:hypothetical protein
MPKRKTVKTNYNKVKNAIDCHKIYRGNNTSFCLDMGFENRTSWVSDLKRNRNLPSPEEAAQMCLLLHTPPEEILLTKGETEKETAQYQEDIALVHELMEKMQGGKEAPAAEGEGSKEAASNFIKATNDRAVLLALINEATKKLQELE